MTTPISRRAAVGSLVGGSIAAVAAVGHSARLGWAEEERTCQTQRQHQPFRVPLVLWEHRIG